MPDQSIRTPPSQHPFFVNQLVFATRNPDKVTEIRGILGSRCKIISLEDLGFYDDIPEDHDTLDANARFKAEFVFEKFGMACFADDTGLEVEAIGGAPGVYSARFAALTGEVRQGEDASSANIRKLLGMMDGLDNRRARFRTVISLVRPDLTTAFEGIVEGHITRTPEGSGGFGYDPVFRPVGSDRTFAGMSFSDKNLISHRSRAIMKLAEFLAVRS